MTIVAERLFMVRVKMEVPNITALDDATAILHNRLSAAVPVRKLILGPGREDDIRIITRDVARA